MDTSGESHLFFIQYLVLFQINSCGTDSSLLGTSKRFHACSTDLIGQGAYGVVYRGTQRSTGSTVAIKRIPFADATPEGGVPCNVIREISLLRELDHDNVVKLLDVIQAQPGGLYLVFEFVSHDLKSFMDKHQTSTDISERVGLPKPMVKNFLKQILAGVGFCHTYRVLHRDLKPHNVSFHCHDFINNYFKII